MSVPIAMIPYTNMAPYRQLGPPSGCHFVPLVPKASIAALETGRVLAAAVPVGGLDRLAAMVETVGRFGIAAKGPCMSVLFFSRLPFEQMHAPKTLRVTHESATSVRLLYLLLGQTCGFDGLPLLVPDDHKPDAELLIGDRALIRGGAARADPAFIHVTDLSEAWFDIHGLPFVFARWVVRRDAPESLKTTLARWLHKFKEKESLLVAQAIPEAANRLKLSTDLLERYFRVIRRSLDGSDLKGQQRFLDAFDRLGRRPLFHKA